MAEVLFIYEGQLINIQCNKEDKMKDIIHKFKNKIKEENNNFFYTYNGEKIDEELKFNQIVNEKKISLIVHNQKNNENKSEKEIISNEIICPICKENIFINFKDYKINLNECKNGHKMENILFNEYENIQKMYLSKIICNECCKYKSNINEEFYLCNECSANLCPLCKFKHNKSHNIINYNDKYSICKKHNNTYIKYCKECKENICFLCINEHKNHNIIDLLNIIPNKDELLKEMKYLNEIINKFKDNIKEINNILNKVLNNIEIYYKIFNNIINSYNNKNRNYEYYYNLNEIKIGNNNIINDLNNIINENNINNKFKNIIDIYNKIIRIKKTKIFENGDKYIGEFINGIKNGKGILHYNKNNECERSRYKGDFKDGKLEGKGILFWNNGDRYEGDFKNDKAEGKGIYYFVNGDRYEGDSKDGESDGKGIYYYKNGDRYEGDFKYDKSEGKGIFFWINGDIYKGDFKKGKKEGKGILYFNDGDIYDGEFKDNKIEGKGIYYYNDGIRYEGDFKDSKKEGKGIYYVNDGSRYEGEYKNDKTEGKGIIYFNNGDREMGDYLNGEKIGIHIKLNANGIVTQKLY